mmetsp:Transcript_62010/g.142084  ORF Transcript_62010/g.142084 Transcript_62010/m.142084 type:complete len:143 (-) Transcript_62010:672-1100(-)
MPVIQRVMPLWPVCFHLSSLEIPSWYLMFVLFGCAPAWTARAATPSTTRSTAEGTAMEGGGIWRARGAERERERAAAGGAGGSRRRRPARPSPPLGGRRSEDDVVVLLRAVQRAGGIEGGHGRRQGQALGLQLLLQRQLLTL